MRLYDYRKRYYLPIVLITETAWRLLNGEIISASLETATNYFPEPVKIVFKGRQFVIVTFELWKSKILQRHRKE